MTDLAETIARVKGVLKMPPSLPGFDLVARADLTRLLDAAEAGMRARDAASDVGFTLSTPDVDAVRDAALEEAAAYMDKCGLPIQAKAIRSLRSKT